MRAQANNRTSLFRECPATENKSGELSFTIDAEMTSQLDESCLVSFVGTSLNEVTP